MLALSTTRRYGSEDFATEAATTTQERGFPRFLKHFEAEPDRKWQVVVLQRLLSFTQLQTGWNSYGGSPLKWDAGMFALSVLHSVMRPRTPIPQTVPSPEGGVQLEWHEKDIDLELHISAPYRCDVWFRDHRDGSELEMELSSDFAALTEPIRKLSTR